MKIKFIGLPLLMSLLPITGFSAEKAFDPTIPNSTAAPTPAPEGMVWIPGGEYSMGSDKTCESLCDLSGVAMDAAPIHSIRSRGAQREEARPSRRLVPLHQQILHPLHGRHPRQR